MCEGLIYHCFLCVLRKSQFCVSTHQLHEVYIEYVHKQIHMLVHKMYSCIHFIIITHSYFNCSNDLYLHIRINVMCSLKCSAVMVFHARTYYRTNRIAWNLQCFKVAKMVIKQYRYYFLVRECGVELQQVGILCAFDASAKKRNRADEKERRNVRSTW